MKRLATGNQSQGSGVLMALLMFASMLTSIVALLYGAFAAWCLAIELIKKAFRRRGTQAVQYLALLILVALSLAFCAYLLNSQPVAWPFHPAHIPFYIVSIAICHVALRVLPEKWIGDAVPRA